MKKLFSAALVLVFMLSFAPVSLASVPNIDSPTAGLPGGHTYASYDAGTALNLGTLSTEANGYTRNARLPQTGYIFPNGEGFTIVTARDAKLFVEDYISGMTPVENWEIALELPVFGAVHKGTDGYYYVLTGQNNIEQDDKKEVMCLTRYTGSWERAGAVSVGSAESIVREPFRSGCPRMADDGKTLAIHTSRLRFTSADGLNHQSNLSVTIDLKTMSVVEQSIAFPWNHVSHSFDQYVLYDGAGYTYIDHGDAYPRSLVLHNSKGETSFYAISGKIGDNYTGVSLGGAALSPTHYLVAGNSIDQKRFETDKRRNIMVSAISRTGQAVSMSWFTNLSDGQTAGIPHLVKIDTNSFMLMWEEFTVGENAANVHTATKYQMLDGAGKAQGQAVSLPLRLNANAEPLRWKDGVLWYTINQINGKTQCMLHVLSIGREQKQSVDQPSAFQPTPQPTTHPAPDPSQEYAAGLSNYASGSIAAFTGKYIYYMNTSDFKLWRMDYDRGNKRAVGNHPLPDQVQYYDGWVYFRLDNGKAVMRLNPDNNSAARRIVSDHAMGQIYNMQAANGYVYFTCAKQQGLHRVSVNGGTPVKLIEADVNEFTIAGSEIYLTVGTSLLRYSLDGQRQNHVANDASVGRVCLDGGYVYYAAEGRDHIVKIRPDGTGRTVIRGSGQRRTYGIMFNVSDGWIYFLEDYDYNLVKVRNMEMSRQALCRIRTDGTGFQELARDAQLDTNPDRTLRGGIAVYGGYVYFTAHNHNNSVGNAELYRVPVEGGRPETLQSF